MHMRRRDFLTRAFAAGSAYTALWRDARAQGTSRVPNLKITGVRAVELEGFGSRFVRVYTDQGLTGTGEMVDNVGSAQIINDRLGPALVGMDPLDIEAVYFRFWGFGTVPGTTPPVFMRGSGGGPYLSALSGVDIALWDLAGKALGVPIYRLLGGKIRDKVAIYVWWPNDDVETKMVFVYRSGWSHRRCRASRTSG